MIKLGSQSFGILLFCCHFVICDQLLLPVWQPVIEDCCLSYNVENVDSATIAFYVAGLAVIDDTRDPGLLRFFRFLFTVIMIY